jgi:hypothetical protein
MMIDDRVMNELLIAICLHASLDMLIDFILVIIGSINRSIEAHARMKAWKIAFTEKSYLCDINYNRSDFFLKMAFRW